MPLTTSEVVLRLAVATLCAGVVGLERERREAAAGLRTHALVGLASALAMVCSAFGFSDVLGTPNVSLDPSRIAAQVISGIGFLGAGTIIVQRETVRGLTTAASVWAVAAIGIAVGGGLYKPALAATALALTVLAALRPFEKRLARRWYKPAITALYDRAQISVGALVTVVDSAGLQVERVSLVESGIPDQGKAEIILASSPAKDAQETLQALMDLPGVRHASFGEIIPP
ncbi:MAG TPA: MgtC/SapB family protein [Bryobacteraceae bacterium]|jgi:putative Mg2+ transporter-C (MgtC) family protein|nr:MgtC/SapB family protein [Bryobacteraceae bacterium]